MRGLSAVAAMLLLGSACTSAVGSSTSVAVSESVAPETIGTTDVSVTAPPIAEGRTISGVLPDGTDYSVRLGTPLRREVEGISAGIVIDLADGSSPVVGITAFGRGRIEGAGFSGRRYSLPAGDWTVTINIYSHVLEEVGPGAVALFESSIHPQSSSGLPSLELEPPFRWATDEEIPLQMGVAYEGFVVRRGCGELAVACNSTRAVQVIPADRVFAPAPEWIDTEVWVESVAPRPPSDEFYLDPGPLLPRAGHDVIWTGEEMIVWGGTRGDGSSHLFEGAAFDPITSKWRLLTAPPLDALHSTAAVWTGAEMVVISKEATVAYDPKADNWRFLGDGREPPRDPGLTVATGDEIFTWTWSGIQVFGLGTRTWTALPSLGFGFGSTWRGALRILDGRLIAVGNTDSVCEARRIARWDGFAWEHLPSVSLATETYADCSSPNQTAVVGGRLIVWEENLHPSMAYDPQTGSWTEMATIPLDGTEGPEGPVEISDRLLVTQYGSAAIFDPAIGDWISVDLPGWGSSTDMVWTGEELLMWGAACCYGDGASGFRSIDAWRWQPPD